MFRFAVLVLLMAVTHAFPLELDVQWKKFKLAFNKNYDSREEVIRRFTWEENLANIIRHNIEADLGKHSYKMGINHLADMNTDEVSRLMKGYKGAKSSFKSTSTFVPYFNIKYPDEVDWRKEGMVTPVKNQKACGSCWAFSATGSVEGQHKKKTGKLVSLSEQNLVDCASDEGNRGCEGGLMFNAFEYIIKNGGIDTEACYPYDGRDGPCRFNRSCIGATISGYVNISSGDEDALFKATATVGPISVAIDASLLSFQLYRQWRNVQIFGRGGVYDEPQCSSTLLDHGVLIVGYGTENGKDYWLVKNSWGAQWGDKGYIKMSRNKNNQCGIATAASYPIA